MTNQFTEIVQVELALRAAERMIGQATVNMDEQQLLNAQNALSEAKCRLEQAKMLRLNPEDLRRASSCQYHYPHQIKQANV